MYNLEPKIINHNQHLVAKNQKKISEKINEYYKKKGINPVWYTNNISLE